jgi:pimeloyl-ACP methyl ester carboxylesterase
MPEFEYDNHRISFDEYGEGDRPLVLIHGLLMNRRMFDRLGPEMAERGNRVITVDLLGHGRSDRPPEMSRYSMTFFARQVEALLDHLDLDQAVVGGTSLGANTTLELNHLAPERVKAMMIEMPVLDNALLAAAVIFTPIMVGLRFGEPVLRRLASGARRIPRTNPLLGHHADPLHPFSDSGMLAEELPNSRLIEASSILEWRLSPERLDNELANFLDQVWEAPAESSAAKVTAESTGSR